MTGKALRSADDAAARESETSREIWARWRLDREARELQRKVNAELEAREAANLPIYPRECAERLADDTRMCAPDWRHIRPTLGPAWHRLLKAQPELSPELTKEREATITAVFAAVPASLRGTVSDLRTLIDLMLAGHETAAYLVGYETGRRVERMRGPRTTRGRNDAQPLRLHLDAKGGA